MCRKIIPIIFRPKYLLILCTLNLLSLVGFYAVLLVYIDSKDSKQFWDGIVFNELEKLMDPTLPTVEQMAESVLSFTTGNIESTKTSNLPDKNCSQPDQQTNSKIAIIVPYRNRQDQLQILLNKLTNLLNWQRRCFQIYVVEQFGQDRFNKGSIMNAGFLEAMKLWQFDCVMFHDVDLIPENLNVPYQCTIFPTHISVSVDSLKYKLPYPTLVGGVLVMSTYHFLMLNGYSNMYWDWGAEDDDLYNRMTSYSLPLLRPNGSVAKFTMLKHKPRPKSPLYLRHQLLFFSTIRYRLDGLNSLSYNVLSTTINQNYIHLLIDVGPSPF